MKTDLLLSTTPARADALRIARPLAAGRRLAARGTNEMDDLP